MQKALCYVETVRPSRDGHEYHETWAARKALGLLLPGDGLVGISIEGLSEKDQKRASKETAEIADLVLYYGRAANFKNATKVCIIQAKYSIGKESEPFTAADATKTVKKFGATFRSQRRLYGIKDVRTRLEFAIVTNRPLAADFNEAIKGLASAGSLSAAAAKQAKQFKKASGLKKKYLKEFAQKFQIFSSTGNLQATKLHTTRLIADWSGGQDAMAKLRIGEQMKQTFYLGLASVEHKEE